MNPQRGKLSEWDHGLPPEPSDERLIWRYLTFTQLVSILEREALWFNRADMYDDPLEGSRSKLDVLLRDLQFSELLDEQGRGVSSHLEETGKLVRASTYLNCWHMRDRESMAMWDLYSRKGEGIAIRTTVGELKAALKKEGGYVDQEESPIPEDVPYIKRLIIGKVRYIDYDRDVMPSGNIYTPFFHKRASFSHERELRVAATEFYKFLKKENEYTSPDDLPPGRYLNLDLPTLISRIHVSPTAEDWFFELVKMVVSRYRLSDNIVVRSSLDDEPVF